MKIFRHSFLIAISFVLSLCFASKTHAQTNVNFEPNKQYSVRSQSQLNPDFRFFQSSEKVSNSKSESVQNNNKLLIIQDYLTRNNFDSPLGNLENSEKGFGDKVMGNIEMWYEFFQANWKNLTNFAASFFAFFTRTPHAQSTILFTTTSFDAVETGRKFFQEEIVLTDFLPEPTANNDLCSGVHNSQKKYTVSESARLLSSMLKKGPNNLLSQFRCNDPYDDYIPEKAKEIYLKSITWFPRVSVFKNKIANDYLQCVAFVFMSYQMSGTPIEKRGRTNADDFLAEKYTGVSGQFNKYQSGIATVLPKEGDIAVWSKQRRGNEMGHAGVVIEVREDFYRTQSAKGNKDQAGNLKKRFGTIRIANSNSSQPIHEYQYIQDEKTKIVKLEKVTKDWVVVPDYWLRLKEL